MPAGAPSSWRWLLNSWDQSAPPAFPPWNSFTHCCPPAGPAGPAACGRTRRTEDQTVRMQHCRHCEARH
eukprot:5650876-Pyramimonas_sp.AAC.1